MSPLPTSPKTFTPPMHPDDYEFMRALQREPEESEAKMMATLIRRIERLILLSAQTTDVATRIASQNAEQVEMTRELVQKYVTDTKIAEKRAEHWEAKARELAARHGETLRS